jgi:hypothetical protein
MLVSHTIDWINYRGEVLTLFETRLLILILLSACGALQNFLQIVISITLGICVTDLNVENSGPPSLLKAVWSPRASSPNTSFVGLCAAVKSLPGNISGSEEIR